MFALRLFTIALFMSILFVATGADAQDETVTCDVATFQATVNSLFAEYKMSQGQSGGIEDNLNAASELSSQINREIDRCIALSTETVVTDRPVGDGSLENPFAFGELVDTGAGFNVQIVGYIRPADAVIRRENMFNDRPAADEVYVILQLQVTCQQGQTRCESNYLDYEMVGDLGIVYEHPYVVYDNTIDFNGLGGASSAGDVVFLVKKNDTNLRLLFHENYFNDSYIAMAAEPEAGDGLQVTATSNLNVRTGPSTTYGVAGSLQAGIPVVAFGRNEDGSWLKTGEGWLFAELLSFDGDVMALPVASE
jgi:hypothetical protein